MAGYLVNFSSLSLIASLDKIPSWGKKQIGEDCQPPPLLYTLNTICSLFTNKGLLTICHGIECIKLKYASIYISFLKF